MTCGVWKKGGVKNGDHECNSPHLDRSCELTDYSKDRSDPECAQEATRVEAVLSWLLLSLSGSFSVDLLRFRFLCCYRSIVLGTFFCLQLINQPASTG